MRVAREQGLVDAERLRISRHARNATYCMRQERIVGGFVGLSRIPFGQRLQLLR